MKIRGWHVEGFGIHRDWRVDDLPGGLDVFYGPNEAGKSTLLAFLRGVLFGYPDGRSTEPKYEPRDGAAHGGRVVLAGDAGEVVVERFAGRGRNKPALTLEDGRPGGEPELRERLGRADAGLFRNVFAFGLRELQELGALGDAGVQDHLFAAGVTGGGRPARESARELRDKARSLFDGPKGRKKTDRARLLIAEIAELNADLYARQELAETYPALRDRLDSLEAALRELDAGAERERRIEQRASRLVELWNEVWCPLAEAREQTAKLAPSLPESLPADAGERLDAALARVQRGEEQRDGLRRERSELAAQLEALPLDEAAFAVAARVDAVQARLALDESQRTRLEGQAADREACQQRVAAALSGLFPDRDAEAGEALLRGVQSTPTRREELRAWQAREEELLPALREAETAARLLDGQLEAACARVAGARERLAGRSEPGDAFEDDEGRDERDRLLRRQAAAAALRLLAPRLRAAEADLERETASVTADGAGVGLAPAGLAPLLGIGVAALCAAAAFVWVGRLELAAAVIVLAAGGVVLQVRSRRASARVREAASRQAQEALLEAGRRLESARAEAAPHLASLGLDAVDDEALARVEADLASDRERIDVRTRLRDELRDARAEVARLEEQRREQDERITVACRRLEQLHAEFDEWKQTVRIPGELGVAAAVEFLEEVRRGRDALDERDRLDAERRRLRAERDAFRAEVDAVLEAGSDPGSFSAPEDDAARLASLESLRARCAADRAARDGRVPLLRREEQLRARLAECEASLEAARGALSALLEEAGAADVAALKRSLELAAEAAALEDRVTRGEAELERRLAGVDEDEAAFLRGELARGAVTAWEEQAEEARARAAGLREERDVVLREHQDRTRDRTRLEESTDVIDLELRKAELVQELQDVLGEWRRLRVAAQLLEESVRRFEEAHQPGVLQEAQTLFERVTGGRYPRIVQTEGREGFAVLTADGQHRQPAELSQGTTEQLYLCMRLGLVAEMARAGRALPVVMDDVLVNFDDERAAAMAEVLGHFAAHHQVLFFTCSSRTRDLLAAAPNASLHRIGRASD